MNRNQIARHRPYLSALPVVGEQRSLIIQDGKEVMSQVQAVLTAEQWVRADQIVYNEFRKVEVLNYLLRRGELLLEVPSTAYHMEWKEDIRDLADDGEPMSITRVIPLPFCHADVPLYPEDMDLFWELLKLQSSKVALAVEKSIVDTMPSDPRPDNFRLVLGMPPTLMQWDSIRGWKFKVACIIVPWNKSKRTEEASDPIVVSKPGDWIG